MPLKYGAVEKRLTCKKIVLRFTVNCYYVTLCKVLLIGTFEEKALYKRGRFLLLFIVIRIADYGF